MTLDAQNTTAPAIGATRRNIVRILPVIRIVPVQGNGHAGAIARKC